MIDRILFNGNIRTLNTNQPCVSALALYRDRVVAVGDESLRDLAGPDTVLDNLGGRTVLPGLTDAHIHFSWLARALQAVDLFLVPSKAEMIRRVAERAASTPSGEWITGRGWAQDRWADRAFPTLDDLDPVTPNHPIYLNEKSGHTALANSAALRLAGITASTPDPDGGVIGRDEDGNLNGLLFEEAINLVQERIPAPSPEQLADWMHEAQELAWQVGLTGIHDFDGPDCLQSFQILREQGRLGLRVVKNVGDYWIAHALGMGLRWGFGDDWIRIGGQKIFADGALGPRTAAMIAPYEGEPENYGIVVTEKEDMAELVLKASALGLPSTIHAIGDRAMHDVLDVFEMARQQEAGQGVPRQARRHRIEHVQVVHPDDLNRLGQLDIIASMQPIHATADYEMVDRYWGERGQFAYNWRAQLEAGAVLAFGSDAPVDPFDPRAGIHAAVTRHRADGSPGPDGWYPDGRLSLDETLRGYTYGPAYAAGMENRLGQLAPGFLADLVVLDQDFYAIAPDAILTTDVVGTMVGGVWRHRTFG